MYFLKNFISTLRRYWVSSILNVIGMAVAFAAFFLILTQATWNLTFNHKVQDSDRIFLLSMRSSSDQDKFTAFLIRPLGEKLIESCGEIEMGGIFQTFPANTQRFFFKKDGENITKIPWRMVGQGTMSGYKALGYQAADGSLDRLAEPNTLAFPAKMADKYGIKVGDLISTDQDGSNPMSEVVAIFAPTPENSDLSRLHVASCIPEDQSIDDYANWQYPFYLKLKSAEDREKVLQTAKNIATEICKNNSYNESDEWGFDCDLIPLRDLYYQKTLKETVSALGNRTSDISLLAVGILILLVAMVNYINFFFALIPIRIKSVNTYKIFGLSRTRLVLNFLSESAGTVLVSMLISVLLIVLFCNSQAAQLLTAPATIAENPKIFILTICIALLTTIASSIYPALYITSFQPALAIKSGFSSTKEGKALRTGLTGLQFVISIALIICTIFVKLQRDYMMDYDIGFDRENLITGTINSSVSHYGENADAFADRLRQDPRIIDVAWADGDVISNSRMGWGRQYRGKEIWIECYPVSYNFLNVLGIEMSEGRNFTEADELSEDGVIIYNEDARRAYEMDFETPVNGHNGTCQLAGFCKDFNFRPLQYKGSPFAFYVFGKNPWRDRLVQIYVRTVAGANPYDVMDYIQKTVLEFEPDRDLETITLSTFNKAMDVHYQSEKKVSGFLTLFTLCSIILSLIGVFGIVLFDTQHRSREIAVRRVMGARIGQILLMFNRKFAIIIGFCFLIAAPVSWIIVNRYFNTFAYHMSIEPWVFAVTLIMVTVITLTIVTLRSLKAATENPVESIKQE